MSQTVRPTELEDHHSTLMLLSGLQTLFFTFTMLWMCPVKKRSDLVKACIFYKSEKTSSQTIWPIKIKTVVLSYLIMAA